MKSQGIREQDHHELSEISRLLKKISAIQKKHDERQIEMEKTRATSSISSIKPEIVRAQIQSFKLLGYSLDIPGELQKILVESCLPTTNGSVDVEKASLIEEGCDRLLGEKQNYKNGLGAVKETIINNRITQRLAELERLPSNIGTLNSSAIDLEPSDALSASEDLLKIKALIELKSLRLLTKQKSLRQHIIYNVASTSDRVSESMTSRAVHRRVKVHSPQELRLSEQLEFQQRMERERREREVKLRHSYKVCNHANTVHEEARLRRARIAQLGKQILQSHNQIEREESRRAERTAKQRLQALRANDEEAYIKLLDQTKDTRITHLLRQTNAFLDSLAQRVKVQQLESGTISDTRDDDEDSEKIDYYEVAHRVKESVEKQPSILVGGTLKEYQIKGLQWMVSLYNNNLNGILADEMGLGKTIQSISLIAYLYEVKRQPGPYLVIVPLSTLTNWTMEFEKWAPSLKKVVYKGPPNARKSQQGIIRSGDFQILLTTYEYIIKDRPILSKIKWTHMIIDEGHRMKNTQSKLSFTLTQYYYSKHRLILTGTPLQNNLPELWALLNFVLPKIFNSVKTFDEWFNTPFANTGGQDRIELTEEETLLVIRRLHKVLRPFLLRRLKKDVEKDLPDKVEKVIKCKMSALQSKLYDQMLKHNVLFIGESNDKTKMSIKGLNNKIMQLRKICNHPFVFEEVENLVNPTRANTDELWRVAGKFELLDRILPKFKATGHRILLFFQMTQVMDIMEDYMRLKGHQYLRLDGSTKAEDRSELLKLFNAPDSPYFAFLLSTRAGGLGLNLQTADTVIIYDTDWNPHQDLQAQDRAHRIGQTREVRILRLITEDTVEEVILERAHAKLEIDGKVIQAGKFDQKSTAEEQEAFLRNLLEAEELRREQNDEDEDMDDEELNIILARNDNERAMFRRIDQENQRNGIYGKDKEKERLMTADELPEEYTKDIKEVLRPQAEVALGRGARERKTVYYDDGLTEEQWLDAVDNDDDTIEDAIERKRKRQERRQEKMQKLEEGDGGIQDEDSESSESAIKKIKVEGERKGKRGRPPKITLSVTAHSEDETSFNDTHDSELEEKCMDLLNTVRDAEDESGHTYSDIFLELPSKKLYPDYYQIIEQPIALDIIEKRIQSQAYTDLENAKADFDLMLNNARSYNEPASFVYEDADALQEIVNKKFSDMTVVVNGTTNGNGKRKSKRRSRKF